LSSGGSRVAEVELNLRGPDLVQLQGLCGPVDGRHAHASRPRRRRHVARRPQARAPRYHRPREGLRPGRQRPGHRGDRPDLHRGRAGSKFKETDQQYDIWLRADPGNRRTPDDIADLTVASRNGTLVRLGNLVRLHEDVGPAQIDRIDRQRSITILGDVLPSLPLGDAVTHTEKIAHGLDMPPLYNIQWRGARRASRRSSQNFLLAFALSFLFMYMVLAAQFESFVHPITILLALPLVDPVSRSSRSSCHEALNIYSTLGLFMLLGVVKKNGILQVDYTNTLRAQGMPRDEAILRANRVRLRPILMTTVMLVLGMIPIALGQGPGSGSRARSRA
jgi:HAE1 family hydrophobic/amphiphilic exporter-1